MLSILFFLLLKWDVSLKLSFVPDVRVTGLVLWYVSMSSPSDRSQVKGKIWINERWNSNHDSVILLGAFCRNILGPSVTSKRRVTANQHTAVGSDRLQPMIPHFFRCERCFLKMTMLNLLGATLGVLMSMKMMWITCCGLHSRQMSTQLNFGSMC